MAENEYLLEMQDVNKSFPGVHALDNARLCVKKGTVHALMGENGAGKSTLMKCLFGIYRKDSGSIKLEGKEIDFANPTEALLNGISMVHQELEQVRERNVMDNVWLGRYPVKGISVDEKKMYEDTVRIFSELEIDVEPKRKLMELSVSQRQMVDIGKAVSYDCKIIVLDEPTSSLTENEVEHLFRMINTLRDRGVGIIYISHKLDEIFRISDEVTVMRDGKWVGTKNTSETTMDEIISMMVGRELTNRFPPKTNQPSEVMMSVQDLSEDAEHSIKDITFDLRRGEILGIAGLMGAGRTELLETIYGYRKKANGTIKLFGKTVDNKSPNEAIKNKFALCTEERRFNGIFSGLSVSFNSVIAHYEKCLNKFHLLNTRSIRDEAKWVIDNINVKTPSQETTIRDLSGGNQQKVIIGRWLLLDPDVLLMDDPTRGIDVGAKYEIYQLMIDLASRGKGIIVSSSELPELLGICDRIMVLSNGRLSGIVDVRNDPDNATQENIFRLAAKYL